MITIGYDPAGNVTLTLDPRGQGSTNTYDAANRRTLEVFSDGSRSSYTYDNVNNRLTAASAAGVYTSSYEPRNLLSSLKEPGGKLVTYAYDSAQRRISMNAYGKGLFTYTWDAAGRQTKVTSPALKTTSMSYDGLNRLVQRKYANNALTTQLYDPAGNLQVIGNVLPSGTVVDRLTYTYDKANHRKSQWESDSTRTTWTYDKAYQLLNERAAGGPANTSYNVTHSYDPAGNRTLSNDGTTVTTYSYSVANRITLAVANGVRTTFLYDLAGNRTKQQSPSQVTVYNWDAAGRMISADLAAGIATFTYNADGRCARARDGAPRSSDSAGRTRGPARRVRRFASLMRFRISSAWDCFRSLPARVGRFSSRRRRGRILLTIGQDDVGDLLGKCFCASVARAL